MNHNPEKNIWCWSAWVSCLASPACWRFVWYSLDHFILSWHRILAANATLLQNILASAGMCVNLSQPGTPGTAAAAALAVHGIGCQLKPVFDIM